MSRRIVPWTFYACMLLVGMLLFVDGVRASRPSARVLGTWDGFYQATGTGAAPGVLYSAITEQRDQRIVGDGMLFDSEGLTLYNTYNFAATLAREDFLVGTGRIGTGRLVFQSDLETFPGVDGDAGVMNPEFLFVPARGHEVRVGSILLRPFPDADAPDIAGGGAGTFYSLVDPNFRGAIAVDILPEVRGSFPGHVSFLPASNMDLPFSWQLRATTSADGRFVMIAQGGIGKLLADGDLAPHDAGTPQSIDGLYRLNLLNGRVDFGAYNFTLAPSIE